MDLIKKIKKNKLNIAYIIAGGVIVAMGVTNCAGKDGGRTGGGPGGPPVYGEKNQSSWHGLILTTLRPGRTNSEGQTFRHETLSINNTEVYNGFLELFRLCANTRWSGLHAQFAAGAYACNNAVNNLVMGLNIFTDYNPEQNSYAKASLYIWHRNLPVQLHDQLEPWVIDHGRFTRLNNSTEFEIVFDLSQSGEHLLFKIRVNKSPEEIEECEKGGNAYISLNDKVFARASVYLSDDTCYSR